MKTMVPWLSAAFLFMSSTTYAAEKMQTQTLKGTKGSSDNAISDNATSVIWFDLMVEDTHRAKAFYADVFGWQFVDEGNNYILIQAGGTSIGGLIQTAKTEQQAGVTIYFPIARLDDTLARAKANGATVILEPMPIPGGHGTMTLFWDLDGNPIGLIESPTFAIEEKSLPPVLMAGIRISGSYPEIGKIFSKLGRSVGGSIAGKPFGLFYDTEYKIFKGNPSNYLTEIQIVIQ